jgi:1,4-dihydroxy-2-naphthoyl-CoA hydrolase
MKNIGFSYSPDSLNQFCENSMVSALGIKFIESAPGSISARMPVDRRTTQPFGFLHGGANASLIETLGSVGSGLIINSDKFLVFGIEINVNHLKSVNSGFVTGTANIIKAGSSLHVWDVRVVNEDGELCAIGRLTVMVVEKRK